MSSSPWLAYVVVAALAFGAGLIFSQIVLRPSEHAAAAASPQSTTLAPAVAASQLPASPSDADGAVALGNQAYDQQHWTAAIAAYQRAIALGRDTPDVRTDLGNAYRFSGDPHKALEEYEIAQRQNPNHEQSLFNQGALYVQSLGDPITGAAKWREFVARFPSSPTAAEARRLLAQFESQFGTPMKSTTSPAP